MEKIENMGFSRKIKKKENQFPCNNSSARCIYSKHRVKFKLFLVFVG